MIDSRIPLLSQTADFSQIPQNILQTAQGIQNYRQQQAEAPVRQALLQNQVDQIPIQQQQQQLQLQQQRGALDLQSQQLQSAKDTDSYKSMVFGSLRAKQLLDAGDTEGVLRLADERAANITARGGQLDETAQVAELVRAGKIDEAKQRLNNGIEMGKQLGILKPDENNHTSSAFNDADAILNAQGITSKSPGYAQKLQSLIVGMQKTGSAADNFKVVGGHVVDVSGSTPKDVTPSSVINGTQNSFGEQAGDLLAALAAKGISLPAGMRSKEQQVATLNGLLRKFPNMAADDIATNIGNGQINFGSDKKAATVAAGQEGKVATAVNELSAFGDQALAASAAVPRGSFIPINQLMQMADTSISDPNLLTLKLKMNALNNAYNVLSARGGTDAASRAHVAQLFASATGDEGVRALVKGLKEEGVGAKSAARDASHIGGTDTAAPQSSPAAGGRPPLSSFGAP